MLNILVTLVLFAIVIYGIINKYNTPLVLFITTILGYVYLTIVSGGSVMGDATIGSTFLDIFEKIAASFKSSIGGAVLIIMLFMGYASYMAHMKASEMFCVLVSSPMRKIKNSYLLACGLIIVGALIKIVIPSTVTVASLFVATFYPVLLMLGCTKMTAASAMILSGCWAWGPSDGGLYTALALMGIEDVSVAEWFVNNQIVMNLCMLVVEVIVFFFVSRFWDKQENAEGGTSTAEGKTPKDVGVPYYYAILPALPLIIILIFSQVILGSIVISVIAATLLSIFLAFLVNFLSTRKLKASFDGIQACWTGMAEYFKMAGILILFGTAFAGVLGSIGGLDLIMQAVSNSGAPTFVLVFLTALLATIFIGITGSFNASLPVIVPCIRAIVDATAIAALPSLQIVIMGGSYGLSVSPVSAANIFVSSELRINVLTLMKRNAIPVFAALIAGTASAFIFYIK